MDASSVDVFVRFRSGCGIIIWHHIMHPSIIPLTQFMHTYGMPLLRHCTDLQGPYPPFTTENMLRRWYIFHHTTRTSPDRRQIGKHIWRKRFDAHVGQPQIRSCRARAVSREQTRRVDTENAIAKKSEGPQSTQVPRPVCGRSQQGNP